MFFTALLSVGRLQIKLAPPCAANTKFSDKMLQDYYSDVILRYFNRAKAEAMEAKAAALRIKKKAQEGKKTFEAENEISDAEEDLERSGQTGTVSTESVMLEASCAFQTLVTKHL